MALLEQHQSKVKAMAEMLNVEGKKDGLLKPIPKYKRGKKRLHVRVYKGVGKFKYLACSVTGINQSGHEINTHIQNLSARLHFTSFWCPRAYAKITRSVYTI